jgi:hypothetical protein
LVLPVKEQNQKAALNLTFPAVAASSLTVLLPTEPLNSEFCNGFWEFWSKNTFSIPKEHEATPTCEFK